MFALVFSFSSFHLSEFTVSSPTFLSPLEFYLPSLIYLFVCLFTIFLNKGQPFPPILWWVLILSFVQFATFVSLGTSSLKPVYQEFHFVFYVKSQITFQRTGQIANLGQTYLLVCLFCLVGFRAVKDWLRWGWLSPAFYKYQSQSIC